MNEVIPTPEQPTLYDQVIQDTLIEFYSDSSYTLVQDAIEEVLVKSTESPSSLLADVIAHATTEPDGQNLSGAFEEVTTWEEAACVLTSQILIDEISSRFPDTDLEACIRRELAINPDTDIDKLTQEWKRFREVLEMREKEIRDKEINNIKKQ